MSTLFLNGAIYRNFKNDDGTAIIATITVDEEIMEVVGEYETYNDSENALWDMVESSITPKQ